MKSQLYFFYDYVFPNFILPNAINPQMGIINYIHTLYHGGATTDAFLERDLGDGRNTLLKKIFGDHMGLWPTTLRHNGPHLRYNCYQHLVDIVEDAVYLGKQKRQKYIYPIKLNPHFNEFVAMTWPGAKLHGEFFWKYISQEVLDDVKSGNAVIFLDWAQENYIDKSQFEMLHYIIRTGDLPRNSVILGHNSFNAEEIYQSMFDEHDRIVAVKSWPFLMFQYSHRYGIDPKTRMTEDDFNSSRSRLRNHHFLFRNRRGREYRLALLYKMASDQILDRGDWSMLEPLDVSRGMNMANYYSLGYDHDAVRNLHQRIPHSLESEPDSDYHNTAGWSDTNAIHSTNAYFDITTETYMDGSYKSFTEKICKPLLNFQPFLLIGFTGGLKLLKELGFKTFSPWIDESYDTVSDSNLRLSMIYNEIHRLSMMSKHEIHNWYWEMEDILLHNHRMLINFYKNDQFNHDFIRYLESRIS